MHSSSLYGLKLSVLRGVGAKTLATDHRVIRCPLNTGFTVYRNPKLGLACSRLRGQVSLEHVGTI